MNDLYIRDNPDRVGDPETPVYEHFCDNCGEGIWGDYYQIEDWIFCESCISDSFKDDVPEIVEEIFMDLMNDYKRRS